MHPHLHHCLAAPTIRSMSRPRRQAVRPQSTLAGLLLWVCVAAQAHGPTPQKVDEAITIAAPPEKVWALVGDFGRYADWNPTLRSSKADKDNLVGSQRQLVLHQGGQIEETLDEVNTAERSMAYRSARTIDPKVFPASSYSVRLRVQAEGNGSKLEWRARAYRADTGNEPAPGQDDAAAVQALQNHIRPALMAVKTQLER